MSTPTQRSKKLLESRGYLVAITEKWNPHCRIRQDLFGFIDMIAIRGNETLAIQTTSGAHVSERIAKINSLQAAALWLECPTRKIIVHGWAKRGERGKRKLWTCREIVLLQNGATMEWLQDNKLPAGFIPPETLATRWADAMHSIAKADQFDEPLINPKTGKPYELQS